MHDDATPGLMVQRVTLHGSEYVWATVMQRRKGQDHPLGVGGSWYSHEGKPYLEGLRLGGHVTDFSDGARFVSHGFGYYEIHCVELPKAKAMAAVLTKISRQCQKDDAHEHGDVFMSFARAVGAHWVAFPVKGRVQSGDWSNTTWLWRTVAEGRNTYRDLIRDAVAELQERLDRKVAA